MTETMWKILDVLRGGYLKAGAGYYRSTWSLGAEIGKELAGCGVPYADDAIEKLEELGLIEELSDLHCRYRIVISTEREE